MYQQNLCTPAKSERYWVEIGRHSQRTKQGIRLPIPEYNTESSILNNWDFHNLKSFLNWTQWHLKNMHFKNWGNNRRYLPLQSYYVLCEKTGTWSSSHTENKASIAPLCYSPILCPCCPCVSDRSIRVFSSFLLKFGCTQL